MACTGIWLQIIFKPSTAFVALSLSLYIIWSKIPKSIDQDKNHEILTDYFLITSARQSNAIEGSNLVAAGWVIS